nr:ATP-binding cassette transporter Abca1-like2 [Brachionus angularis]
MFKQLYLLLWKNLILRKRRKFRLFVEIFWPLFLFIITSWVRTRIPRTFETQCHFSERSLPSGGLFPFLNSFICELDDHCYNSPRTSNKSLKTFAQSSVEYLNKRNLIETTSSLLEYGVPFMEQRKKSLDITNNFKLKEALDLDLVDLENLIFPVNLNETVLNLILDSIPNLNYLYSSYSNDYLDPVLEITNGQYLNMFNLLYGSGLENIDLNRFNNKINDSNWLRSILCNQLDKDLFLLKSNNQYELNQALCALNNDDLESLFVSISSELDLTLIKQKIFNETFLNDKNFLLKTINAVTILNYLKEEFIKESKSNSTNKIKSIKDILINFDKINLSKSLCGNSESSIFEKVDDLLKKLDFYKSKNETKLIDLFKFLKIEDLFSSNKTFISELDTIDYTSLLEQANNLNKISECLNDTYLNKLNEFEKSKSCFCKQAFKTVLQLPDEFQVYFKQARPLFFGKILYTSNKTNINNLIINKANTTFKNIENFSKLLDSIVFVSEIVMQKLNLKNLENIIEFENSFINILNNFFNFNIKKKDLNLKNLIINFKYLIQILKFASNSINCVELNRFVGYETEDEAVKVGADLMDKELFWSLIVFDENKANNQTQTQNQNVPKVVNYRIRMNASKTQDTSQVKDQYYSYEPKICLTCNPYFLYGFIYIQDILEKSIIEIKTNRSQNFGITTQLTPYPCHIRDKFLLDISKSLPLFMVIAWVYTVSTMVKDIVYEKEKRLKEFMQIMGLSNGIYWLSWFISSFLVMFFVSVITCVIIKFGKITIYSDFSLILVFFTCFIIATITQCFLISIFFNKASLASVVAGIIYFIFFLPYTILINYSETLYPWQKFLVSLSSTVAFSYGSEIMATYELQAKGIKWSNIHSSPFPNSKFTMFTMCCILLFDAFLYMVLAWYIEAVFPGEYGIPKKWYFPFQKSYWLGQKPTQDEPNNKKFNFLKSIFKRKKIQVQENFMFNTIKQIELPNEAIDQSEILNKKPGIEIKNLHKVYARGKNHALKGLTVNFYENEISAFLGHNGAGKSTTMHLLTGLYKPSFGSAKINGLEITDSMEKIRKSLGFVPQHNILFSKLTVWEHLIFYSSLKGINKETCIKEAEHILEETGLNKFRDKYAKNLSGGMQRILSIAIAFIGDSKTVILDEPTAGVDVGGRRSVWDLLLKYKSGRTLIISTHHLDEAEILSDRVAIISNGELIAYGSPYFLKKKFGNGYYLTFAKKSLISQLNDQESVNSDQTFDLGLKNPYFKSSMNNLDFEIETGFNSNEDLHENQEQNLEEFLKSKIKNCILIENNCTETTFSIPNDPNEMKNYPEVFNYIEENMEKLGIESVGISDTSLEEIFIKLVKQPKTNTLNTKTENKILKNFKEFFKKKEEKIESLSDELAEKYSSYTNLRVSNKYILLYQQMFALIIKRFHRVKRNKKGFLAETVLPIVFVCLALFVSNFAPPITDKPSLELHPWLFETTNEFFISRNSSLVLNSSLNESNSSKLNSKIWKTFLEKPGPGNRCLKDHKIYVNFTNNLNQLLNCESFDYELIRNKFLNEEEKASFIQELKATNFSHTKISCVCNCSYGFPQCPKTAGGDIELRNLFRLKTNDILYDLSNRNVTDWLIKTELNENHFQKRYGGLEFLNTDKKDQEFLKNWKMFSKSSLDLLNSVSNLVNRNSTNLEVFLKRYQFFLKKNSLYPSKFVKLWYNTKGYHANVAYLNVLNNALMRTFINESKNEHGILAHNHPMKFSKLQFITELEKRLLIDLFVAIFILFALSFIPASFLVFFVEERENNSKQLQFVSGVKPFIYWLSNFIWDLFNYLLPAVICIIVFLIFDTKTFTSKENFPCLVSLIFLYGWSCIPLMYPINYLFKLSGTSFVISSSLNIFIGVGSTTTTTVLNILTKEIAEISKINNVLKIIFTCLFPHYCLGQGLLDMSFLYNIAQIKKNLGYKADFSPFEFNNIGRNLLAMSIQGFAYFILNLLIQYKFFVRLKPNLINEDEEFNSSCEDDDVIEEKKRVFDHANSYYDYVKLINLTKVYKKVFSFNNKKKHVAVKSLSMGIKKGECFGLLGINGAGKSTTFKMITGEIRPSYGDVFINGYSISQQREKAYKNLGYCPQKNAIFPLLTAKEHLIFYARLRGIPEQFVKDVSIWALNRFGLNAFANRIAQDYSGGNKRKLSTAIAILGNPTVICLDEPTSGMDVKVRRVLWKDILSLIKENRIVILTSHSMAECESLCTRLAIMVDGQFRCLGSPQHLKSKYGNGYRLILRKNQDSDYETLIKFIEENFYKPVLKESHKDSIEFKLPFEENKLSKIFRILEENRDILNLKDYSICQTTLDQIFVNISESKNEKN